MAAHEGWESELFVEPPDESDLCGICCEVLEDAVETQCGHSFCEKCIFGWLQQRQVCPQDQLPLNWSDCRSMVRDRRRILGLKVKCPFDECGEHMELRQLRSHQRQCSHKPDDWEDPRGDHAEEKELPSPITPVSPSKGLADDEPAKKAEEPEFVIELEPAADAKIGPAGEDKAIVHVVAQNAHKDSVAKNLEAEDRLFALQMQMQEDERARGQPGGAQRNKSVGGPVRPAAPSVGGMQLQLQPEPLELAPAHDDGVPYQEIGYQAGGEGRAEGIGAGVDGAEILRPPKKNRCCNDKVWCCFCCVFWVIVLVIGGIILVKGSTWFKQQLRV